jgi:hypothetical protein
LQLGAPLDLVPEPDNPHAENGDAVAVKHAGRHLGYIPNRHSWIARVLTEGKNIGCVIDRMEKSGWVFQRVRFIGLRVTVLDDRSAPQGNPDEARARALCIDGLRVLAHLARSDNDLTSEELAEQAKYIVARLQSDGIANDADLIEGLLAEAQSLIVSPRSFSRALNLVAKDKQHFAQVLASALAIVAVERALNNTETTALTKIQSVGRSKGWI